MPRPTSLLIVDDDTAILQAMRLSLTVNGFTVHTAASGAEGLNILSEKLVDTVVVDFNMPEMNGMEFLERAHGKYADIPIIMATGFGTIKMAVDAMKKGAYSYLTKPMDFDEMILLINQALEKKQLVREVKELKQEIRQKNRFDAIITQDRKMQEMLDMAANVAATDATVLIQGETGTGKELIARAIHFNSHKAEGRFVGINCTALPENLLESELFGHVKGAFTGATSDREGRFEAADGGTILLDEIGDISPAMQAKLLRVLQEREFTRVGSNETIKVDVRIIATTNRNMEEAVHNGQFRQDLFFRLNVIPIHVPPLRERKNDIVLLAKHFLEKYRQKHATNCRNIPADLVTKMLAHHWPGNVRELENCLERAVIFSDGEDLDTQYFSPVESDTGDTEAKCKRERQVIIELEKKYAEYPNALALVASKLGVNASTLYRKRKKYGLI